MKLAHVHAVADGALENASDGFGHQTRVLLRTPSSEFSASTYSVTVDGFTAPNRDYPYEGFSAFVNGENTKGLDALFIALADPTSGTLATLTPARVHAWPHKATYHYHVSRPDGKPDGLLAVEYYAFTKTKHPLLALSATLHDSTMPAELLVRPLTDLRPVNDASRPGAHHVHASTHTLAVVKDGVALTVFGPHCTRTNAQPRLQEWRYKLGNGFRTRRPDGQAEFVPDTRALVWAGELAFAFTGKANQRTATVLAALSPGSHEPARALVRPAQAEETKKLQRVLDANAGVFVKAARQWGGAAGVSLAARHALLLHKFTLHSNRKGEGLEAGAYWFRECWVRDAAHAVRVDARLFSAFRKRATRQFLLHALSLQHNGLVPNRMNRDGTAGDYQSADATLETILAAHAVSLHADDPSLAAGATQATRQAITAFSNPASPVHLDEDGLLSCPAHYSWLDSRVAQLLPNGQAALMPTRLPPRVAADVLQTHKNNANAFLQGARFRLVEVNALWIAALDAGARTLKGKEKETLEQRTVDAKAAFVRTFTRPGLPAHTQSDEFDCPFEESAAALEAMALVPELFSTSQKNNALSEAERTLFARQADGKLYGVVCRNTAQRVYFGDAEYHAAVVWPRCTPALLSLLRQTNHTRAVQEVLQSNLERPLREGALLYSPELFSLPASRPGNPPVSTSTPPSLTTPEGDLVPVKNPAQLWSHFCQPYHDYLTPTPA